MTLIVVAYDISNDRRRVRLHTLLLGYGYPVQESRFDCDIEPAAYLNLKRRIARIVRPNTDQVRLYRLCLDCAGNIEDASGNTREPVPGVYIV